MNVKYPIEGETPHSVVDGDSVEWAEKQVDKLAQYLKKEKVMHHWGFWMRSRDWAEHGHWALKSLVQMVRRLSKGKEQGSTGEEVYSDLVEFDAKCNVMDDSKSPRFPMELAQRSHDAIADLLKEIKHLTANKKYCRKCGGAGSISYVDYGSCREERDSMVCPECHGRFTT